MPSCPHRWTVRTDTDHAWASRAAGTYSTDGTGGLPGRFGAVRAARVRWSQPRHATVGRARGLRQGGRARQEVDARAPRTRRGVRGARCARAARARGLEAAGGDGAAGDGRAALFQLLAARALGVERADPGPARPGDGGRVDPGRAVVGAAGLEVGAAHRTRARIARRAPRPARAPAAAIPDRTPAGWRAAIPESNPARRRRGAGRYTVRMTSRPRTSPSHCRYEVAPSSVVSSRSSPAAEALTFARVSSSWSPAPVASNVTSIVGASPSSSSR